MRSIRQNEIDLIGHMLKLAGTSLEQFPLPSSLQGFEYEGGKMGSLNLDNNNPDNYAGDIMAVEFLDNDGVRVVVTLTVDKNQILLDLDFWKEDFNALIEYPTPENVKIVDGFGH